MSNEKKDFRIIQHIYDYCVDIEETLAEISNAREKFNESRTHRSALSLYILQIGELVSVLSDEFKEAYPQIPWREVKQMRNQVAHHYGAFDFDILWEVVHYDIPELKKFCESFL